MAKISVIDPGHGGSVTAGKSTPLGVRGRDGALEKDITLELAQRVARHLGPDAVLTRRGDVNVSLGGRIEVARRRGAAVFVSLHVGERDGAESFVHPRAGAGSRALARAIQRALGGRGAAVQTAELAVLSPSHHAPGTAACLVELAGLARPEAARRLGGASELDRLGRAIARAVREHLDAPPLYGAGDGEAADPEAAVRDRAVQQMNELGGIVVAAHVQYNGAEDGQMTEEKHRAKYRTFQGHAAQFAADHGAIGLAQGALATGADAAMVLAKPLPDLLRALSDRLDIRAGEAKAPMRVRTLAIFTHGIEGSLKADVHDGRGTFFKGSGYAAFLDAVAEYVSADCLILLFACRTAGRTNQETGAPVDTPFAEGFTLDLAKKLRAREGEGAPVRVELWGHEIAGHVTANHTLVRVLSDPDATGGRRRDTLASFVARSFLRAASSLIAGRDDPSFTDHAAADALEARVLAQLEAKLARRVQREFDVDGDRNEDATDHPRMVFNRDLPIVGLERLCQTLEYDWYNGAASGAALAEWLRTGTSQVRGRFARGYEAVLGRLVALFDEHWAEALKLADAPRRAAIKPPPGVTARARG